MKTKLIGLLICMLLIATALPAVGTIPDEGNPVVNTQGYTKKMYRGHTETNPTGVVLWDNGMHYHGSVESQWDALAHYVSLGADDFQFEDTTMVADVHWTGGYWSPAGDFNFDWNVSFYSDRGDGMAPGTKIYEQVFPNTAVHETFIEEIWGGWIFSYWVDLTDEITFVGGNKYWISIQGISTSESHACWGCHAPIVQHVLVWMSPNSGYPDWTDCTSLWYHNALDYCFQLTGEGDPPVADLECNGDLSWDDVPPGALVTSNFTVSNNGDIGSMLRWEILSVPEWGTEWSLNWTREFYCSTDYGYVGTTNPETIRVEVIAPEEKNKEFTGEIVLVNSEDSTDTCTISISLITPVNQPVRLYSLFQMIGEWFPHAFTILKNILEI